MLGEKDTTKTDSDMYDRSINQQDFCMERERDRLLCKLSRNPTRDPAVTITYAIEFLTLKTLF
jgi:hypothetical protein